MGGNWSLLGVNIVSLGLSLYTNRQKPQPSLTLVNDSVSLTLAEFEACELFSFLTLLSPALYAAVDDGDADDNDDKDESGDDENNDDLDAKHEAGVIGKGSTVQLFHKEETRLFRAVEKPNTVRFGQIFDDVLLHSLVGMDVAQRCAFRVSIVPTRISAEQQRVRFKFGLLGKVFQLGIHLLRTELKDKAVLPIFRLNPQIALV